ncbi:MAG: bifunctional diaminohydroxyphosphoribosylaminopyrimidine deaminase/5-amino-6-(5-phosphoribosylamino)uracil reductase RibD [Paludibacter sp.]|nr:bifunctional diaminohydroxyphosphoribosylaminopyrimidine deaminase/5-amino-6-(5-phosphoribosylamino)uracil reductase RibD [Paludibacter sp.]
MPAKIMKMDYEEKYMHRCLQLAAFGGAYVAPNPMVGAVLVSSDRIIGEGYHHRYGEAHAEPNAINAVTDAGLLKDATLYVNLEPCSHYGKTPPCADLIVSKGIPRVVIGTLDPNPKVSGRGVEILRKAGIEVTVGVLENECNELNHRFFIWQREKRPWILLKWAQTSDGFMDQLRTDASIKPLQISNSITRQLTHKIRAEHQAIMVSTNTVLLDNPSLTVRNWAGKNPVRLIIDRSGRIPQNLSIFDQSVRTIIFTEQPQESKEKIEYQPVTFDENSLRNILKLIAEKNIHSVLVEGGSKLLNSFIEAGLWDEANVEISEENIGTGVPAPQVGNCVKKASRYNHHWWINYQNMHKKF